MTHDTTHETVSGSDAEDQGHSRPTLAGMTGALQRNYALVLAAVGYMLALFPFNWALSIASGQAMLQRPFEPNAIIDIGEAVGFALVMAVALLAKRRLSNTALLVAPFAFMAAGSCLVAACALRPSAALAYAGDLVLGFGYAVAFVMWLDLAAKLPPKKMLVVVAIGYLFNFASFPVITDVGTLASLAYAIAAAALSGFLWFAARAALLPAAVRPAAPAAGAAVHATVPAAAASRAYLPPVRLVALCIIIPFAYGFCTSYLGVGASSLGLKIGFALPAAIIVVGLSVFYRSFNLSTVYWITCPLMIVGLLSTFFLNAQPTLSKSLITAALSSVHFVAFMVVRVQSQEAGRSPVFAFALLNALMMIATKTSKEVEALFSGTPWDAYIIVALITAVALSCGLLVTGSNGKAPFDIRSMLSSETEHDHAMRLAQEFGLSKRETSVYTLLLEDKSNAEIAEALFIAPSTVRAHISRIYEKFDVHTRQEFARKTRP